MKQFDSSLWALKSTLPTTLVKTFNEWIAKHQIILPSALPAHIDHSSYSFHWNSAAFSGPFIDGHRLSIEQQQTSRPLFKITWSLRVSKYLDVFFYNPSDKIKLLYYVSINASQAFMYDWITSKNL